jgi:phage tail sheath protein FI
MPGVSITTAVRTGPTSATVRNSSQAFFVGLAQRGPADEAVLVTSLSEFEETFGTYVTYAYLHPTVQTFFEEGGTQCYIARVVGPGAEPGTLNLNEGGVGGSDCITLTANGPGNWSDEVYVVVSATNALRNIKVYYGNITVPVYQTGNKSTTVALVNAINNSPIASKYLTATKLTDDLPEAVTVPTALSGGDDDRTDNTVDTSFTAYVDALDLFLDAYGTGAVACPETTEINTNLIAHANAYNRIALLHLEEGATDLVNSAATLAAEDHSEHAALYYPWVYVPTEVTGVSRLIPPLGFVAGKRALAHNQTGPHQPYAGLVSGARFVSGVEVDVNRTLGDSLDEGYINAIRLIANSIRVYGARSLSTDTENFRFITIQDTVNSVVFEANASMEDLVFAVVDGRGSLFATIEGRLTAICERMKAIGALYEAYDADGRLLDPGYSVKCDTSINTTAQLASGMIRAQLGVRVSSVGDKIEVTIIKSNLTSSITV